MVDGISVQTVVSAVTELAVAYGRAAAAAAVDGWGIGARPHPLVSILQQRPSAWPAVLHSVRSVLRDLTSETKRGTSSSDGGAAANVDGTVASLDAILRFGLAGGSLRQHSQPAQSASGFSSAPSAAAGDAAPSLATLRAKAEEGASHRLTGLQVGLQNELIRSIHRTAAYARADDAISALATHSARLLVSMLPELPADEPSQVITCVQLSEQLFEALGVRCDVITGQHRTAVFTYVLGLACDQLAAGALPAAALELLPRMAEQDSACFTTIPGSNGSAIGNNSLIAVFGWIMWRTPAEAAAPIVELLSSAAALPGFTLDNATAQFLLLPVIGHLTALPENTDKLSSLLRCIQDTLAKQSTRSTQTGLHRCGGSVVASSTLALVLQAVSTHRELGRQQKSAEQACAVEKWTDAAINAAAGVAIISPPPSTVHLPLPTDLALLIAAGLLCSSNERAIVEIAANALAALASESPGAALAVASLFVYSLGDRNSSSSGAGKVATNTLPPLSKVAVLRAYPMLAHHRLVVSPILRFVLNLGATSSLKAMSITLLTQLWMQQSRVLPEIQNEFTSSSQTGYRSDKLQQEKAVARAQALLEVCSGNAEPDTAVAVGAISMIVNEERDNVAALSMALAALVLLCERDLVDPRSAWSSLAPMLEADTRPLIVAQRCKIYACFATACDAVDATPDDVLHGLLQDAPRRAALNYLWQQASARGGAADASVRGAATAALARFHPRATKVRKIVDDEDARASAEAPQEHEVNGGYDLEELQSALACVNATDSPEVVAGYSAWLSRGLQCDVELAGRMEQARWARGSSKHLATVPASGGGSGGCVHAAADADGVSAAAAAAAAVDQRREFLGTQYRGSTRPGLRKGLATAMLYSFCAPVAESQVDADAESTAAIEVRAYFDVLGGLLVDAGVPDDKVTLRHWLQSGWDTFMSRTLLAAIVDEQEASATKAADAGTSSGASMLDAIGRAVERVADKLWGHFKAIKKNPQSEANFIFAMGGLVAATPPYPGQHDYCRVLVATLTKMLVGGQSTAVIPAVKHERHHWQVEPPHSTAGCNAAGLVLGHVLPILGGGAVADDALVSAALKELARNVSNHEASPLVRCGCAVGLGQTVGRIFLDGDFNGDQATVTPLLNVLDVLWKTATNDVAAATFASSSDPTLAAATGLVYATPAFTPLRLCSSGLKERFAEWWAVALKMSLTTTSSVPDPSPAAQMVLASMRVVATGWSMAAISAGIAGHHTPTELFKHLSTAFDSDPTSEPTVVALAQAGFAAAKTLSSAADLNNRLACQLAQYDGTAPARFAAVLGLVTLVDAEVTAKALRPSPNLGDGKDEKTLKRSVRLDKLIISAVKSDRAAGVSAAAAVLCGKQNAVADSDTVVGCGGGLVPTDLDYLPSELYASTQALFDTAANAGAGAGAALACLALPTFLPPVDWTTTMRTMLTSGDVSAAAAVKLAIARYGVSPSLRNLVESLLAQDVFVTLPVGAQVAVCLELPDLLASFSPEKISGFLSGAVPAACKQLSRQSPGGDCSNAGISMGVQLDVLEAALSGMLPALLAAEHGDALAGWAPALHALIAELYSQVIPTEAWAYATSATGRSGAINAVLVLMAQCFSHMPHAAAQEVLKVDSATATYADALRATLVRSRLVGMAGYPLSWLIPCYTWLFEGDPGAAAVAGAADDERSRLIVAEVLGATFHTRGATVATGQKQQHQRMLLDLLDRMCIVLQDGAVDGNKQRDGTDLQAVHQAVLGRGLRVIAMLVIPENVMHMLVLRSSSGSRGSETLIGYGLRRFLQKAHWNHTLQRFLALQRLSCCMAGPPVQWMSAIVCELRHMMRLV